MRSGRHAIPWRWILGLTALGCVLRLWRLGAKPPWYDELYSVFAARRPLLEAFTEPGTACNPPLFYGLTALFGRVSDSLFAIRLPSALAGTALVAAIGVVATRIAGRRAGIIAALLVAVSPFQIRLSQEARMYTLIPLLALFAMIMCERCVTRGRTRDWIGLALALAASVHVHYVTLVLFGAVGVRLLLMGKDIRRVTVPAGASLALAGALIAPIAGMFLVARSFTTDLDHLRGGATWIQPGIIWIHFVGYMRAIEAVPLARPILAAIGLGFLVIVIASVPRLLRDRPAWTRSLLAFSVAPGAAAILYLAWTSPGLISSRHLAFAFPGVLMLIALALARLRWNRVRAAAVTTIVAVNAITVGFLYGTPEACSVGWSESLSHVAETSEPGDALVVFPDYYGAMYTRWRDPSPVRLIPAGDLAGVDLAQRCPRGLFVVRLSRDEGGAKLSASEEELLGEIREALPDCSARDFGDVRVERRRRASMQSSP